ncbi:uncharacterized protein PAC_09701 [Phialocephala subalpina]|uniref:Uncharacterized protein n=1 Tax=Phialocephala subalpina TaxID=576137 RepID=A0A1L7X485_9HELO|nr:uncharacterized protein PAC_09701 [Phialocephala subalpina]
MGGSSFSIGPNLTVQEGELCYHPEGVEYGPQLDKEDGTNHILLILHFGGVSGQGYVAYEELLSVQKSLSEKGRFEGGRYFPTSEGEKNGEERGIDGFQATWEKINGRELAYPDPKYAAPVLMKAGNFGWVKDETAKGVWKKALGIFTERETRAEMVRIDEGGKWEAKAGGNALQLIFVTKGSGSVGEMGLERESAVRLLPGERGMMFESREEMEMLRWVIPQVEQTQ